MTPLREKIDNGLEEARLLVLGTEVLLGITFRTALRPEFSDLAHSQRLLQTEGLALLIGTLALLMLPTTFHRLVEDGNDTTRLQRVLRYSVAGALFLFGAALGIETGVAVGHAFGRAAGLAAGGAVGGAALVFWWGVEAVARMRSSNKEKEAMNDRKRIHRTDVNERVRNILTEARLILPGAQALLGFQLAATVSREFRELPAEARAIHLASLGAICLATIFLMTPSAYHRIVARGENDARFERLAGRWVVAAMVPLALGISGDFYVVLRRTDFSAAASAGTAVLAAAAFIGIWFVFPLLYRRQKGGFESD